MIKRKDSDEDKEQPDEENPDVAFDDPEAKSRNPVRRVNSSPEMSSNWKTQFMSHKSKDSKDSDHDKQPENEGQQKKKGYGKDMRVSCEAIPEEIAGSGGQVILYECRIYSRLEKNTENRVYSSIKTNVSCIISKLSLIVCLFYIVPM